MKRKENGSGSIKQRSDGRWEGQYTSYETGIASRHSVYGKTKPEVRQKLTEKLSSIDRNVFIKPDKITVKSWLSVWQQNYLVDVKPSTISSYEYFCRVHIVPHLGKIRLQALTGAMIQSFYTQAQKPHTITLEDGSEVKSKGLSPASVKALHNVLSRAMTQAIECGYIGRNPCDACKLPRVEKKEMHTVSDVRQFLEALRGDPYENLFILALFTGMRQSEIIGLTWPCVDFDTGIISIEKQYQRIHGKSATDYEFSTLKNSKKRIVAPAQFVMDALGREKKRQAENKLRAGAVFNNKNLFVFTDAIGQPMKYSTLSGHLKNILQSHGLPDIRFHDLRHSFATLSLENGDDIKVVSEALGHATTAFTMDVYSHVTDTMKKRSSDRMQAYIDSVTGKQKQGVV